MISNGKQKISAPLPCATQAEVAGKPRHDARLVKLRANVKLQAHHTFVTTSSWVGGPAAETDSLHPLHDAPRRGGVAEAKPQGVRAKSVGVSALRAHRRVAPGTVTRGTVGAVPRKDESDRPGAIPLDRVRPGVRRALPVVTTRLARSVPREVANCQGTIGTELPLLVRRLRGSVGTVDDVGPRSHAQAAGLRVIHRNAPDHQPTNGGHAQRWVWKSHEA